MRRAYPLSLFSDEELLVPILTYAFEPFNILSGSQIELRRDGKYEDQYRYRY